MIETEKTSAAAATIREATERFGKEIHRSEPQQVLHETGETAGELYEQVGGWMQENYGKTIAAIGVLTLAGIVGYMIGRNSVISTSDVMHS